MAETEKQRDIISVAVVPFKQKLFVQPKLKNNNLATRDYIIIDTAEGRTNQTLKLIYISMNYTGSTTCIKFVSKCLLNSAHKKKFILTSNGPVFKVDWVVFTLIE